MKICSSKDLHKAVDRVFEKASRRALTINKLNDTTLQVDIKRATDARIKRPDQALNIAQKIKSDIFKEFREAGFNEDFITEFQNDIVRITDYSQDSGIVIVKKVISDRLVNFVETSVDMLETQEQLMQEAKDSEAQSAINSFRESEYQHAESLGFTREEFDTMRDARLDVAEFTDSSSNEANSLIYDNNTSNYLDALEDTARTYSAAPSPVQNFTGTKFDNYVKFKQNQKYRLDKKLAQVKKLKKENIENPDVLKQLSKAEELILLHLEGDPSKNVTGVIQDIEQIAKAKDVNRIIFSAQNDIARAKYLSNSYNAENLAEARDIINFYKAASDFTKSSAVDNPLFYGDDIANDINLSNIPDAVKTAMRDIYAELEETEMLINNKEQQSILQNLNNLEQIKNNPNIVNKKTGSITYDEIFFKQDGLRDITLGEAYFYDPGTAFIRDNGVVPQAMQVMLENAYSEAHTYTKDVVERVDGLVPRVSKVLRDKGYNSKVFGKSVGVDWDIFRAKDSNGLLRDGIVQRYTTEFFDGIQTMKSDFSKSVKSALDPSVDPKNRSVLLEDAHVKRDSWLRKNTVVIDPRKLPEIQTEFPDTYTYVQDDAHIKQLKDLLGEQGYKEEIQKQVNKIRQYEAALALEKDKLSSISGTAFYSKVQQFVNRNSPFIAAENYYNNTYPTRGVLVDYTNMKYSYSVPLNQKGFYDTNFETIEADPDLKEFHNLMTDVISNIQENLTPELQSKLSTTSLPQLQKPLMEIFADPHLTLKAKMSAGYRRFLEFIRSLYSINPESTVDNNLVDLITGKRIDQVNSSFLQGAKENIDRQTNYVVDSFKSASGISITTKNNKLNFAWEQLSDRQEAFLKHNLHPKQVIEMQSNPLKSFDIAKSIKDSVTNDIISDGSFDLPKIAKLFTTLTMEYSARNSVLPSIKLMMEHYKLIKNPQLTQQGNKKINKILGTVTNTGERHNSITQIESWFNRATLGNYSKENEFGTTKSVERDILSTEEKEKKKKFESLIATIQKELDNSKDKKERSILGRRINYYENQIKLLGRKKSVSAFIDANLSFIRALGLGWNISSQVTNLVEGQISNTVLGSTGNFYKPQDLERANNIVLGSVVKNLSFGKITTPGAKKASAIMHKFDVMQDATNELQKASNKNPLDNVNKFFAPFALIGKVEYMNQTPVVVAILMDQEIQSIDGTKSSNVWDALNPDGTLREEFKTTENIENWEKANGEQFKKFTSTVGQAISFQHGDYSKIRGNKASEELSGKVIMMFKRWATMWIQSRLALPHVSLRTKDNVIQKGRLRSATATTGALTGGIFGATVISAAFTTLGMALPALAPVVGGAILGSFLARRYGIDAGNKNNYKQVLGVNNVMEESLLTMKMVALKMIGMPINLVTGRQTVEHNKFFESEKDEKLAIDARNFRANVSEIAIQLTLLGIAALVRASWGDEPEDEKKYNLLSNRIGKLLKQTTMLFDVTDMHALITDFAVIRYVENLLKFIKEAGLIFGDEELPVMKSGPHKGELKLVKTFKSAFLPSLLRDKDPLSLGFGTDLDKFYEFNQIAIVGAAKNQGAEGNAKDELTRIKKDVKKQFIDNVEGLSAKEKADREKMINKLLVKAPKGSYKDLLDNVQQYLDALSSAYGEEGDPTLFEDLPSRKEVEDTFEMEGDIYPEETEDEGIVEETEEVEE